MVSHGNGCAEYQLATGKKSWEITGRNGIQSARRLGNGNTLLAEENSISEINRAGHTVKTIKMSGSSTLRLIRVLKMGMS